MNKLLFALLFITGWGSGLFAEKISNYDANLTIHQSGELAMVETITYDFETTSRHGIYRDIPFTVKSSGPPKDLGLYDFRVEMDGKKVEWEKDTIDHSDAGKLTRLKIGSPSTMISGKHIYRIAYRVERGVLPSSLDKTQDVIRWNMIGTGWPVSILKSNVDLYLPTSLDQSNITVQIFKGQYGSRDSGGKASWIGRKHLHIDIGPLAPHEGLTVELSYPIGLLDQTGRKNMDTTFSEHLIVSWQWPVLGAFLFYLFIFYKKYTGVTDKRSVAPQYYPPKGMDVLQAGLIYDRFVDNDDYPAAILELGQKGYLEIFKEKECDNISLEKRNKNISDLPEYLKYLMNRVLFGGGKSSYLLKSGSEDEAEQLYDGFEKINEMLYAWSVKQGYMRENPRKSRKIFLISSIFLLIFIIALSASTLYRFYSVDTVILLLSSSILFTTGLSAILTNIGSKIMMHFGLICLIFGIMPAVKLLGNDYDISPSPLLYSSLAVIIVSIFAIFFIYRHIGAYTGKGAHIRKHLLGLKEFMVRVKEDEIRRRLEEDPLYLDKALPYAILFGITDHWLKLYDTLDVSYPLWYHGAPNTLGNFSSSVNSTANPFASSSGGSSGGGGFSGGGGGGGGGGGW